MRRHRVRIALAAAAVIVLGWRLLGHPTTQPIAALPTVAPPAAAADRLIVEPDAGMTSVYSLLGSARRSLDLTMYELVDPTAEAVLANDAARGVVVRVLLDHRLEAARNQPAFDYLRARGVDAAWASTRFFVTHEKAFVIDGTTAVVMSLNLTDRYYATSRDVVVVDHDPRDVAAIDAVFRADLVGRGIGTPAADDLVWSPGQSAADLLALVNSARRSVAIESEELNSGPVIAAIIAAERRGVAVSIAMTYDDSWVPAFNGIAAAGGRISVFRGETPLYIHAKLLVVDAGTPTARAFVGSENLSDASLLHDRELGIVLVSPGLVRQVAEVIATDVRAGAPWR